MNAGLPPGASASAVPAAGSCLSVQVMLPRPAAGFNTSRMAYSRDQDSLQYFAFSQWADTPAYMVQPLLVNGLQRSGVFQAVLKSPSPINTRYRLISDDLAVVQMFQGSGSRVRLAVRLQLFDATEGRLVFDTPVALEREAGSNPGAGVKVANALASELIDLVAAKARETVDVGALCPN